MIDDFNIASVRHVHVDGKDYYSCYVLQKDSSFHGLAPLKISIDEAFYKQALSLKLPCSAKVNFDAVFASGKAGIKFNSLVL